MKKTKRNHAYWCAIMNSFFVYESMKSVFYYSWRIKLLLCVRSVFAGTRNVYTVHCTVNNYSCESNKFFFSCFAFVRFETKIAYFSFPNFVIFLRLRLECTIQNNENISEMKWLKFHMPVVPNIHQNSKCGRYDFFLQCSIQVVITNVSAFNWFLVLCNCSPFQTNNFENSNESSASMTVSVLLFLSLACERPAFSTQHVLHIANRTSYFVIHTYMYIIISYQLLYTQKLWVSTRWKNERKRGMRLE